ARPRGGRPRARGFRRRRRGERGPRRKGDRSCRPKVDWVDLAAMPLAILDVNEFWSPSGGGVRRYHLQKMAFFRNRGDIRHVMVMGASRALAESQGPGSVVEHVPAFKFPGNWEYRLCPSVSVLR